MRAAAILAFAALAVAQPRPHYEVASLKPNPGCPTDAGGAVISPGRLEWPCRTVRQLIHAAYDTFADGKHLNTGNTEINGLPEWAYWQTFSLAAKAEGEAVLPMMAGPMLQTLLEDRFKLKIHRTSKEQSVYVLVPAKGGPKLTAATDASCASPGMDRVATVGGVPPGRPCGVTWNPGLNVNLKAFGTPLSVFADSLKVFVDRPVIDRTGIAGRFDLELNFSRDPAGDGEPVFAALRQQLGLQLIAARAPVEYLIVDHIEKLSNAGN